MDTPPDPALRSRYLAHRAWAAIGALSDAMTDLQRLQAEGLDVSEALAAADKARAIVRPLARTLAVS